MRNWLENHSIISFKSMEILFQVLATLLWIHCMDHLEPTVFPIQKGSLNLLRQKWESSDYQRSGCCPVGSRCQLFKPQENKLIEHKVEATAVTEIPESPSPPPCSPGAEKSGMEPELKDHEDNNDNHRGCGQPGVLKEDSLIGRRRIERFSIALDELRSVFETPKNGNRPAEYGQKEVEMERSLCSPTCKSQSRSQLDDLVKNSDKEGEEAPSDKMSPGRGHSHFLQGISKQ
ncbi:xin actin-binding repeat-containing protein 2 isoform X3 [Ochotona princeps]|uniref:xin actin-binding repeat-containing protein 2 isoform X3 n=1 Tax=Ochotona princeps TaxID=9978 RepID=UPI0027146ED7|nr:xin actin-binding repeat-containing protein 2 isoform X3 [Ochotona princeps]